MFLQEKIENTFSDTLRQQRQGIMLWAKKWTNVYAGSLWIHDWGTLYDRWCVSEPNPLYYLLAYEN